MLHLCFHFFSLKENPCWHVGIREGELMRALDKDEAAHLRGRGGRSHWQGNRYDFDRVQAFRSH